MRKPRDLFAPGVDDLDEIGVPHIVGVGLDGAPGTSVLATVPPGQCFIAQRIVGQGMVASVPVDPSPVLLTPDPTQGGYDGLLFVDVAGTLQWAASFRPFIRPMTVFGSFSPITWKSSDPDSKVNWKLRWPLCVPAGWSIQNSGASTPTGNFAIYGRLVSESAARQLGFHTGPTATDADRHCGVTSAMTFTTTQIMVPARTGYSIQILDVHARVQPVAAVLTSGTARLEQGDGRPIIVFANNNPGDLLEQVFAPGIYLKPGESLNCKSSTALIGSFVVSWRYVPETDVPSDHWWACVEPGLPTPTTQGVGLLEIGKAYSHEVTCFYPRRNTTKTSPTKGFQHILRGYTVSIQKEALAATADAETSDYLMTRISTGTSGSLIGYSLVHSITDTGIPLTPIFAGISHDQCFAISVDDVNLPGVKDTGAFWIDQLAFGPATIATPITHVGIDEFWVTLWGKTIPSHLSDPINKGTA